jgi:hypothetical protein
MNSLYWNFPWTQRRAQHRAAQFNAAEELWRSLKLSASVAVSFFQIYRRAFKSS